MPASGTPHRPARLVGAALAGAALAVAGAGQAEPTRRPTRLAPARGGAEIEAEGEPARAIVVTARRAPEALQRSDRTLWVISSEAATRRQPRTLPELLQGTPGVHSQATNRGAGAPIMRGLVGPRNLVLLDGIRFNQSTWRNGPLQYLSLIDPWAIDRVEVQLGPGSVPFGSDAMGGVVHAIPLGPPREDGAHARARVRLRSADLGVETNADTAVRQGALAARVGGSVRSYGPLRVGGGAVVPASAYRAYGWRAQSWLVLGRTTVGVALFGGAVLGAGRVDLLGTGRLTVFDNIDNLAYADVRHRPAGGPLQELRVAVSLRATEDRALQVFCERDGGLARDAARCAARDPATVERRRRLADTTVTPGLLATATFSALGGRARLVLGGDGYHDLVASTRTTATRPAFAPGRSERGNFPSGATYTTAGAFAHAEAYLLGAPGSAARLVAAGGARAAAFAASAPAETAGREVRFAQGGAVGMASLRYLLGEALTTYLSWAQGLRAPNLQETTFLGVEGGAYQIPNPGLRPERSNTLELGVRLNVAGVTAGVAGFATLLDDVIVREPVPEAQWRAEGYDPAEVGTLRVLAPRNAASGRYFGGEASLTVTVTRGLAVFGSAALVQGDVANARGQTAPAQRVPPPTGTAGVRYERGSVYLELFSRWALAQDRLSPGDRADLRICEDRQRPGRLQDACTGTPAWATVHARGGYRVSRALRVDLTVENATDVRYRYHGSGVDEPGLGAAVGVTGEY